MDGLEVAIGRRRPKSSLVLHFDRRVQYAAHAFRGLLLRHGIVCSASGKGSCSDAAVKETFSHTLNPDLCDHEHCRTRAQSRSGVFGSSTTEPAPLDPGRLLTRGVRGPARRRLIRAALHSLDPTPLCRGASRRFRTRSSIAAPEPASPSQTGFAECNFEPPQPSAPHGGAACAPPAGSRALRFSSREPKGSLPQTPLPFRLARPCSPNTVSTEPVEGKTSRLARLLRHPAARTGQARIVNQTASL